MLQKCYKNITAVCVELKKLYYFCSMKYKEWHKRAIRRFEAITSYRMSEFSNLQTCFKNVCKGYFNIYRMNSERCKSLLDGFFFTCQNKLI